MGAQSLVAQYQGEGCCGVGDGKDGGGGNVGCGRDAEVIDGEYFW